MEISSNKLLTSPLSCPSSKSYANRILFLSAFSSENVTIKNIPASDDVTLFINALKDLGVDLTFSHGILEMNTCVQNLAPKAHSFYLGEGGTTIRFFLTLLASIGGHFEIKVEKRYLRRPMDDMIILFDSLGVKLRKTSDGFICDGKIDPLSEVQIDCSKTTQVASAFLLLKKLNRIKKVELLNVKSSQAYLDMTNSLEIKNQYYVPVDFSSLSYFIAWSLLNQDLHITNVFEIDAFQADSYFFKILRELNTPIKIDKTGLTIYKSNLKGELSIDGSKCLDLIPTLAYLFSYTETKAKISNLKSLKFKESDRLKEMLKALDEFEVKHQYDEGVDELIVEGVAPKVFKRDIQCAFDHRIVMMNTLFLKHNNGGEVSHPEAVKKSFTGFFDIFN